MSKVVSFARSADYLHQRAMRNRRESNLLEALDLMRRALECEPENLEYRMDLAELYCEMGCYRQSVRLLLQILSTDEPLNECYFGMCCNYIGMNDLDAAYALILRFLAADPEAIERTEVSDTLSMLLMERREEQFGNRRQRRAARFFEKGKALLRAGKLLPGAQALERGLALTPNEQEPRALLALCLLLMGDPELALRQIRRALRANEPGFKTRCIALQVFSEMGDTMAARDELRLLLGRSRDEDEQLMLLHALVQTGSHKLVYKLTADALKRAPYDAELLHVRAVSMLRLGHGAREAKLLWDRILRVDPGDTIAQYYSALCEKGLNRGAMPEYAYEVPAHEARAREGLLKEAAERGFDGEQWDGSSKVRNLIRWAAEAGDEPLALCALQLAALAQRPGAELLMREYLMRPDAPDANKSFVLAMLSAQNAARPYLVLGADGTLRGGPEEFVPNRRLRPGYRRVLNLVSRAQQPGGPRITALFEAQWMRYIHAQDRRPPRIGRPEGWAAALVAHRLKLLNDPSAVKLITSVFGCSPRMLRHCAHKLAAALPQGEDETH